MKVNAGLYPNANPSLVNSDTKSYALNVLYNEDGETLINEMDLRNIMIILIMVSVLAPFRFPLEWCFFR